MNPDDTSDKELRALIGGELAEEVESRLTAAISASKELQRRLEALSGAANFKTHFEPDPAFRPGGDGDDAPYYIELLKPSEAEGSQGRLGNYEIEEVIAAGGMGVVYKALDPVLQRRVAIKLLSPISASSRGARGRFRREAAAVAALDHPNIIPIHAIDESGELPFLVMRYVDGESLEQRITREGRLPPEEIRSIGAAVSRGLAEAHSKHLVHRDVKPSNILLEPPDVAFVTDFGIALVARASGLTTGGRFFGTPAFTSPEQAEGETIDHRADLFSLGAVLYTMATGKPPFAGDSPTDTIYQVVHKAHPPISGVPVWLAEVIDRLLQKQAADRYQSAGEVAICLENATSSPSDIPEISTPSAPWKKWALVASLLVAVALALTLFLPDKHIPDASRNAIIRIGEGGESFPTLAAAVAAAQAGDTIHIGSADGAALAVGPVEIREEKALTLRALDPDHPPTLQLYRSAGLITTAGALRLEHLKIICPGAALGSPPLVIESGRLSIDHCRFEFPSTDSAPERERGNRLAFAIVVEDPVEVAISHSEFYSRAKFLLRFAGAPADGTAGKISVVDCIAAAPTILNFVQGLADAEPTAIELRGNTFIGESLIGALSANDSFPLNFEVAANTFDATRCVLDSRQPVRVLRTFIDWNGTDNTYLCGDQLLRSNRGLGGTASMDEWLRAWGQPEPGSVHRPENPLSERVRTAAGDFSKLTRESLQLTGEQ